MKAKLVAIQFDRTTEEFLHRTMAEDEAGQCALEQIDAFGDLSQEPVLLNNLPDGDYILFVHAALDQDPSTTLHLIKENTWEIIHSVTLPLNPIMQSALEDGPEFDSLVTTMQEDDGDDALVEAADAQAEAMLERRAQQLEGVLTPYISHDINFNKELLDMLDFMTYPLIQQSLPDELQPAPEETPDIPASYTYNKHTLH